MSKELTIKHDETTSSLKMIETAISKPDFKIEQLPMLLQFQKDLMASQAEIAFNEAKVQMRKDLPKIGKNKFNSQTNSKYVDLEKIKDAVDPVLSKHGFDVRYENYFPTDRVGVTAILSHVQGHSQKNSVELPADGAGIKGTVNKTPVHAIAASITYAERYALCGLLGINTGDNDGQSINDLTEVISPEQSASLKKRIGELPDAKTYLPKFLTFVKAENIDEILVVNYLKAVNAISAKESQ